VTFILEKNVDVAAQEVRDKVSRVLGDLPKGIDPPVVEKLDPDATPVLNVALTGKRTLRETTESPTRSSAGRSSRSTASGR